MEQVLGFWHEIIMDFDILKGRVILRGCGRNIILTPWQDRTKTFNVYEYSRAGKQYCLIFAGRFMKGFKEFQRLGRAKFGVVNRANAS